MKIAVLGPGCAKCKKLFENTQKALAEAGTEAELTKVEDIQEISRYNVFMERPFIIEAFNEDNRRYANLAWLLRARYLLDVDCFSRVHGQPFRPGAIEAEIRRRLENIQA